MSAVRWTLFYHEQIGSTAGTVSRNLSAVMSQPSLSQRLQAARLQMSEFDKMLKAAFQPAPAMPQGGAPPMDPNMMQQGAPPMDPAMMQGAPPMDPNMMQQGAPPPEAAPPSVPPEQLEEMMTLLEQMAQGMQQMAERQDQMEQMLQQQGQELGEVTQTLQSAMQPPAGGEAAQPTGGW